MTGKNSKAGYGRSPARINIRGHRLSDGVTFNVAR